MPDEIDKILEAEASIQKIAAELARLKNAATLLENTQKQNEIVLTSAETVVNEVQNLIATFKEVVSNLSSLNINQRLSELESQVKQLGDFTQKHAEDTSKVIMKTEKNVDELRTSTQEAAKYSTNAMDLINAGQEDIDTEVKKLHTITKEFIGNTTSLLEASDEKLTKINNLLVQFTQKRGLFSLFKKRKS